MYAVHPLPPLSSQYSHGYRNRDFTREQLLVILDLASFFLIDNAREFAIRNLNQQGQIPSVELLRYGYICSIESWVKQGFRGLVTFPGMRISMKRGIDIDTASFLGFPLFYRVAATIDTVTHLRLHVAQTVAKFEPSSRCASPRRCEAIWMAYVGGPFSQKYLHPKEPLAADEACNWVLQRTVPDICVPCNISMKGDIKGDGMWTLEEMAISTAIATLLSTMEPFPLPV